RPAPGLQSGPAGRPDPDRIRHPGASGAGAGRSPALTHDSAKSMGAGLPGRGPPAAGQRGALAPQDRGRAEPAALRADARPQRLLGRARLKTRLESIDLALGAIEPAVDQVLDLFQRGQQGWLQDGWNVRAEEVARVVGVVDMAPVAHQAASGLLFGR